MSALFRWLSRRPLRQLHLWGGLAGWLAYAFSGVYRSRLRRNAALAGVGSADRRAAVAEAGRLVLELPRLWLRPAVQPIADPVRWEGEALIEQHLGHPGGLVILTPHMGSFEVAAQAYAERFGARQPVTVLYRPARQTWLRELEAQARGRPGLATAPATLAGVRQLIRALRRGETVGLLPDQVPPQGQGVWAPFFGEPAYTMTLAARLVQQTGAALLLLWCERLPRGAGYVVRVSALAEPLPQAAAGAPAGEAGADAQPDAHPDPEALQRQAAEAVNRSMETLIRARPGQYLWGYHRYKQPRQA